MNAISGISGVSVASGGISAVSAIQRYTGSSVNIGISNVKDSVCISGVSKVACNHEDLIKALILALLASKDGIKQSDILANLAMSELLLNYLAANSPFINFNYHESSGEMMVSYSGPANAVDNVGLIFDPGAVGAMIAGAGPIGAEPAGATDIAGSVGSGAISVAAAALSGGGGDAAGGAIGGGIGGAIGGGISVSA